MTQTVTGSKMNNHHGAKRISTDEVFILAVSTPRVAAGAANLG